jgi:hypothetical protein
MIATAFILFSIPAFSQCSFQVKDITLRNDEYSLSSKSNEEKSQSAMRTQQRQFGKKKYQSLLVDTKTLAKHNTIMRFR